MTDEERLPEGGRPVGNDRSAGGDPGADRATEPPTSGGDTTGDRRTGAGAADEPPTSEPPATNEPADGDGAAATGASEPGASLVRRGGEVPDMTRERARVERRDVDLERGEPVAGVAVRRRPPAPRREFRPLSQWTRRPRILVTNDDGVESRGLLALKQALDDIGDTVVVAPDTNQSAVGHGKTLMRPLRVRERVLADGSTGWSVDGSPTDAVSLAFLGFFDEPFDLVASGINYGANLGDDITYSGTVSAAMEAVINGAPAFAISQEYYPHPDFGLAGRAAATIARNILEHGLDVDELINVNVPAVREDECEGFEVTRLGKRVYQDELIERLDPRGIPYYWIGGPPPSGVATDGTDFSAVVNRRIAVTPIHLDLTAHQRLARLRGWSWELASPTVEREAREAPVPTTRPHEAEVEAEMSEELGRERR